MTNADLATVAAALKSLVPSARPAVHYSGVNATAAFTALCAAEGGRHYTHLYPARGEEGPSAIDVAYVTVDGVMFQATPARRPATEEEIEALGDRDGTTIYPEQRAA